MSTDQIGNNQKKLGKKLIILFMNETTRCLHFEYLIQIFWPLANFPLGKEREISAFQTEMVHLFSKTLILSMPCASLYKL